jgi:hypothetical protein
MDEKRQTFCDIIVRSMRLTSEIKLQTNLSYCHCGKTKLMIVMMNLIRIEMRRLAHQQKNEALYSRSTGIASTGNSNAMPSRCLTDKTPETLILSQVGLAVA